MAPDNMVSCISLIASIVIASAVPWSGSGRASPVKTEEAACDIAKAAYSARWRLKIVASTSCDIISEADSPEGFYVLALHSGPRLDCELCSTNMGWFAIQKATGDAFEWDTAEMRVGRPIRQ